MTHQPELIPDQPAPPPPARAAARAEYLERLREKLKDPEFCAIKGFPIGDDDDILALSDPPYYTAWPHPFLPEIVARWQAERAQLREDLGLPDDVDDNGNGGEPVYHREPFATDVSEGKSGPIYNAHSYHTKVPHKAVIRYILHYTEPGDVVFDGFCGTGMTGVAAQLCGDKRTVESLGYRVRDDGTIFDAQDQAISCLGARKPVLVDLSPAATFIAYNYNTTVDMVVYEREARRILQEVEDEYGWMYATTHTDGRAKGVTEYTVWSTVFLCPNCGGDIIFWGITKAENDYKCPHCGVVSSRIELEYSRKAVYDTVTNEVVTKYRRVPVEISYKVGKKRHRKTPSQDDIELLESVEERIPTNWFPKELMLFRGEKWGDTWRAGYHLGYTRVYDFYFERVLEALSDFRHKATSYPRQLQNRLWYLLTSVAFAATHLYKYRTAGGGQPAGNNLYIPALIKEQNIFSALRRKLRQILSGERAKRGFSRSSIVTTQSTTALPNLSDSSVDYVFIDPPFGSNIMYSESNFLWESWLKICTCQAPEAIVNTTQGKQISEYQNLMHACFLEMYRVLKPGRWMTVEFHNSQNAIWNAIQEAVLRAGFVVADVRTLDKKQKTFKQVTAAGTVKQDLIISAYKPRTGFERHFLEQAGTEKGAWAFVRQHLDKLPIVVEKDGTLEVVAERQAYLLYDRMVAFHIQRGFSVPLGAAEFYAGLKQRFPERDGMYFLPHQTAEYDRRRMQVSRVEQLALFVTDEKSAIQWLRRELDPSTGSDPQTYQDLQPKFLRELHQARHEALPELSDVLAQNFLKDEQDRWYVPDPARQEDLEKLRERSLLREFQEYAGGKGRLRVFRTEAVRAGFKHAWHERNYRLIVKVAERLPPSVLQEDASLLMYYDNALMRAESEPEQGRLL